jgi:hypothetical protein
MPGLAEIQFRMRVAVVHGDEGFARDLIAGNVRRLEVHRNNYEASLISALAGKFPATCWLAGEGFVSTVARRFIREYPPDRPCIAEYGARFPALLAESSPAGLLPYVRDFAELEWRVGNVAIAADQPALTIDEAPTLESGARLRFQGGVSYYKANWPVDELLKLYLTDAAPERLTFDPEPVSLEIRGSRGEFRIQRLAEAPFTFRNALWSGRTIGEAETEAEALTGAFSAAQDLTELIGGEFITAVGPA